MNAFKKFVEQWGIPPNFPMPKALAAQLADDAAPAPSPKTEPGDNAGGKTGATAKAKKYTFGEGWAGVCIFFQKGQCNKGADCTYYHIDEQSGKCTPTQASANKAPPGWIYTSALPLQPAFSMPHVGVG